MPNTHLQSDPAPAFLAGRSAFAGQILHADLTTSRLWVERPAEGFYRAFIGGRNLILHYLLSAMPAGADPLGADNLLIFAPGLLTGGALPGAGRHAVGGKSPLTGALGSGEAGGWWGAELKRAGFDAVVVHGRAESPVYLWIHDGQAEIRPAAHLWGLLTAETQPTILQELGDAKIRVAQIGPAGENLVRFASVMHDVNRAAGRSGLGAVMGSKRLKALAVRGRFAVGQADRGLLAVVQKWINANYKDQMGWAIAAGTSGSVKFNHDGGATGVNNYRDGVFPGVENLDAVNLFPQLVKDRDTCSKCAVRCKLVVEYDGGGLHIDGAYGGPEYETIGAFGPLCRVSEAAVVAKAHELCAAFGLDTISAGGTLAFAMEAAEGGLLDGLPEAAGGGLPRFGDGDSLLQGLRQIANRQGLGDLMAEGSARMAARLGPPAAEMLAVGRGQEFPLHDPRLKHTMALGYAVSATGADHMHNLNDTFASFAGGDTAARLTEMGVPAPLPLWGISEHKLEGFYYETAFKNFLDCAVICHFYPYAYHHMVDAVSAAGGWDFTPAEINAVGLRAITLGRLFLLREGFSAADDALSARAYHRLSDGPIAGKGLTPQELRAWLQVYYRRMDWDAAGRPSPAALQALGLASYAVSP